MASQGIPNSFKIVGGVALVMAVWGYQSTSGGVGERVAQNTPGTRENRDSGGVINRVASTGNASGSIGNPGAGNPGTQTEGDGELKDLPNNVGPAGKGSGKGQSSDTGK